ncbi:MAG: exosome complex protein Rrp42 [Candidatus Woesearchaeota archaeon]
MKSSNDQYPDKYYAAGIKLDGLPLLDYGDIEVQENFSSTSEGSVRVRFGNTEVLVGVKLEIGQPFEDTPEEGNLIVDANLVPLGSEKYEFGPPSIDAIELARVTDRAIRESKCIDTSSLVISAGEKVWTVIVDIVPLNTAGCLFDISSFGAVLALLNTKFPIIENDKIVYGKFSDKRLNLLNIPITVTVYKYKNYLMINPSLYDLEHAECRLSITTIDDQTIVALQKGGIGSFTIEEVKECVNIAFKKGNELRKMIKEKYALLR